MRVSGDRVTPVISAFFDEVSPDVGGPWYASGDQRLPVIDPSTEEVVATLPISGAVDVQRAVTAARQAFDRGPWPRMLPADRGDALARLAGALEAHHELLADLATVETGYPRNQSGGLHADSPAEFFRWWGETARRGPTDGWDQELGRHDSPIASDSLLVREPVGVVAALSAYNMPMLISSFKVGGALAAGCTCVLMPATRTPLHAIVLGILAESVGIPPGVISIVTGAAETGQWLTTSDDVDLITFTGSAAVGRQIVKQSAAGLRRVVLELGGKSPDLILPDADLDSLAKPSLLRLTRNAGQMCGATTRTLVPAEIYDDYIIAMRDTLAEITVGDPWDPATVVGPLIREEHRRSVEGFVDRAISDGASVLAGGGRPGFDRGFYVNPTLLGDADPDAEICQEEVFGPVGAILKYNDVEEAIALANHSRYGLNANVWGQTDEAIAVARRLKAGTVTINGGGGVRPDAPWPSRGDSGIGMDRGMDGFREFFDVRHIQWPIAVASRA